MCGICFYFNDTATTEIYTLSLHDALPICRTVRRGGERAAQGAAAGTWRPALRDRRGGGDGPPPVDHHDRQRVPGRPAGRRSEEHTSELQSRQYLVCRLLLEKKKQSMTNHY